MMGCEYCREKEKGVCVQKDDMQAVIHRTYSVDIPKNVKKGRTDHEFRQCVCVRTRYRPVLSIHRWCHNQRCMIQSKPGLRD